MPSIGRRISTFPTLRYKKTFSHKIRDVIDNFNTRFSPIRKLLFPNFIIVHYFYIISMTLLASVLMYPCHNFAYIDILFTSAGAATQGGLATIQGNEMNLYQQIIVYVICCLSTPIFIHGSLSFVRLYWFERFFDNIKQTSKQDFIRRRTMTLNTERNPRLNNEQNRESNNIENQEKNNNTIRNNIVENTTHDSSTSTVPVAQTKQNDNMQNFQEKLFSGKQICRDQTTNNAIINDTNDNTSINKSNELNKLRENAPKHSKRRGTNDISPQDIYTSLMFLQNKNKNKTSMENNFTDNNDNSSNEQRSQSTFIVRGPNDSNSETSESQESSHSLNSFQTSLDHQSQALDNGRNLSSASYTVSSSIENSKNSFSFSPSLSPNHSIPRISQRTNLDNNNNGKLTFDIVKPSRKPKSKKTYKDKKPRPNKLSNVLSMSIPSRLEYINRKKTKSKMRKTRSNIENENKLQNSNSMNSKRRATTLPNNNEFMNKRKFWNTRIFGSANSDLDDSFIDEESNYGFSRTNSMFQRQNTTMSANYISWQPTLGRNSVFTGLTKAQRRELGGVEYRATRLLCIILLIYYVGWHIAGFTFLVPWICLKPHYIKVVRDAGISPAWWGFFTSMSSFNDLGLSLTPDSFMSFQYAVYPLIILMWFIIIGNTGFPILLRFTIWILFKISPELSPIRESLGFLLDHPRRCFTLLFPSAPTWWLLLTLVALNFTDWILYIILDFNSPPVNELSKGIAVLAGLFQAVCTRTAGFNVVDTSALHPSIQVSYMLMMYVSVLPLAISIRRTNVYEEQSLGVYGSVHDLEDFEEEKRKEEEEEEGNYDENKGSSTSSTLTGDGISNHSPKKEGNVPKRKKKESARSFIGAHLRRQLSFDLWYLFLGLFIICICESGKIEDPETPAINVFSILFEIVSAYGTVGLSLGFPNTNTSLSAQFTVISKLVVIAMLIRGRHRGLPYSLDRAILLPTEKLQNIDHLEELKSKRRAYERHTNEDPVNNYIKRKYKEYKNKWGTIKRAATLTSNKES